MFLFIYFSFAQTNLLLAKDTKVDSLLKIWKFSKTNQQPTIKDTINVNILNEITNYYFTKSIADSAIKYASFSIDLASRINWDKGLAKAYNLSGLSYLIKGKFPVSAEHYFKSLTYFERINDVRNQGIMLRRIGDIYSLILKTDSAKVYYNKALKILKKVNDKSSEAICLHNMGNNLRREGKFRDAIKMYEISLPLYAQTSSAKGIADSYEEMGISYGKLGDFKKSEILFLKAKVIVDTLDDINFKAHLATFLSSMYGSFHKNRQAIFYGLIALRLNKELNLHDYALEASTTLYNCYKREKNTEMALKYHEIRDFHKSQVELNNKEREIQSLKFEYDNQKQKDENNNQKKELVLRNTTIYYLWVGIFLFLFFGAFLFWSNTLLKKKNIQIEQQKNEISVTKNELEELNQNLEVKVEERTKEITEANKELIRKNREIEESLLKGQTIERKRMASELHDNLGSQISAIRWSLMAIETNKLTEKEARIYENIMKMMNNTYNEVRNISHNLMPEEFNNEGLVGAINKLVNQLNFSEKITFELFIENFEPLDKKIEFEIYCIILELVNNIIKHSGASKAGIKLYKDAENYFNFSVFDNGNGIDISKQSDGVGMENIKNRLASINGNFALQNGIKEDFSGYSFTARINLNLFGARL